MPRPVVDHLWRHVSCQVPLLSDRISDLVSLRKTRKIRKYVFHTKHMYEDNSVSLKRIWMKLAGNSSYKPPGGFLYSSGTSGTIRSN